MVQNSLLMRSNKRNLLKIGGVWRSTTVSSSGVQQNPLMRFSQLPAGFTPVCACRSSPDKTDRLLCAFDYSDVAIITPACISSNMTENGQATLPGTENDILTLDTLENHLWAAADKLRGSIDSADYKNYIFGLLFLKRANDRFEEETEEVAEELGIPEDTARDDRDLHEEFWIPERARWNHIKAQETDVGAALNKALAAIEDENDPIADRVLTTVDLMTRSVSRTLCSRILYRISISNGTAMKILRILTSLDGPTSISFGSSPTTPVKREVSSTRRERSFDSSSSA